MIVILRGFFAIVSVALLLVFAAYAMVIDPVRETGFVPAKEYRTSDPKYDFPMELPVWSILAVSIFSARLALSADIFNLQFMDMEIPAASRVDDFKAAVNVTPLWDDSSKSCTVCAQCSY